MLIDAGHFASDRIENCNVVMRGNWQGLLNRCVCVCVM